MLNALLLDPIRHYKMKIAIIGTRGIPNQHGGFEQLAEYLSLGLVKRGMHVTVYNSHDHFYKQSNWKGVAIQHCYDPEKKMGTAGQFIYDLNCIIHSRKSNYDVIVFLGYTSSSIWGRLYPKKPVIISNMDGLEWKRTKYSKPTRRFLLYAEKLAVKFSDVFIADSTAIELYLLKKYGIKSQYIPYGGEVHNNEDESLLSHYSVTKFQYYLLMARMEPENNIDMILEGFSKSSSPNYFLVLGNFTNTFGTYLHNKYSLDKRIVFLGAIYNGQKVHTLKLFCSIYFHGHSVGGTNPSLIETMASRTIIAAHNNEFNRAILGDDAYYFSTEKDVQCIIEINESGIRNKVWIDNNFTKVKTLYTWEKIIDQYFKLIINSKKTK